MSNPTLVSTSAILIPNILFAPSHYTATTSVLELPNLLDRRIILYTGANESS
ncbi:hypothetical protein RSAG8_11797, partial [Rhizoctonia solani AG-8 WAC10335]